MRSAAKACSDENADLLAELRSMVDFPMELIERTASDELREMHDAHGLVGAYSAVDNGYRNGVFEPKEVSRKRHSHIAKGVLGFCGYFVPRLPYYAWKGLNE